MPLPFGSGVTVRTSGRYPGRRYLLPVSRHESDRSFSRLAVFGLSSPPFVDKGGAIVWYNSL